MRAADVEPYLGYVLERTDFKHLGRKSGGKVRDVYTQSVPRDGRQNDRVILVSTDRYTAFDRQLGLVPFKGAVNTQIAKFWFERTATTIPNHVLAFPDPNVLVARRLKMLPVEMIVRGFMTGVTSTSLWTQYNDEGRREFDGFILPRGMDKNQRLERPVITPTTKLERHDRNISTEEVLGGLAIKRSHWDDMQAVALALFERGQAIAEERGLVLVDTKYEFGVDEEGKLYLADEIHTPDSSRFWLRANYEEQVGKGLEPDYYDKEFGRIWFTERCDPYHDAELPVAASDMLAELACRYVTVYEKLTKETFTFDPSQPIVERIENNLFAFQV